jgi:hypothetical protein
MLTNAQAQVLAGTQTLDFDCEERAGAQSRTRGAMKGLLNTVCSDALRKHVLPRLITPVSPPASSSIRAEQEMNEKKTHKT